MPIQIYRRAYPEDYGLSQAITAGTEGFLKGQQMRTKAEDRTLAAAYKNAQINKLNRESQVLDPSQIPIDPGTGKPAGYIFNNKFYQARQPNMFSMYGGFDQNQGTNITLPSNSGGNTGFLSPQDHYNQLREAGYPKDQARKMAGV